LSAKNRLNLSERYGVHKILAIAYWHLIEGDSMTAKRRTSTHFCTGKMPVAPLGKLLGAPTFFGLGEAFRWRAGELAAVPGSDF
jgi:hypothetical protein